MHKDAYIHLGVDTQLPSLCGDVKHKPCMGHAESLSWWMWEGVFEEFVMQITADRNNQHFNTNTHLPVPSSLSTENILYFFSSHTFFLANSQKLVMYQINTSILQFVYSFWLMRHKMFINFSLNIYFRVYDRSNRGDRFLVSLLIWRDPWNLTNSTAPTRGVPSSWDTWADEQHEILPLTCCSLESKLKRTSWFLDSIFSSLGANIKAL